MLKTWFPHIAAQKSSSGSSRHQISKHFSSHHSDPGAAFPAPLLEKMGQTQLGHLVLKPKQPWHLTGWPAMNLTWIHSTPICNPPLSSQGSASGHSPRGTGASIGVILVLQKGGQPFTHLTNPSGVHELPSVCSLPLHQAMTHCSYQHGQQADSRNQFIFLSTSESYTTIKHTRTVSHSPIIFLLCVCVCVCPLPGRYFSRSQWPV